MTRRECEHCAKNVLTCVFKLHYRREHAAIGGVRLVTSLTFSPTNHNSTHHVRTPCVILSVCTLLGALKLNSKDLCRLRQQPTWVGNYCALRNLPITMSLVAPYVAKILRIVNPIHPLSLICSEWHGESANIVLKMYLRAFLSNTYAESTPPMAATLIHHCRGPPSLKGRLDFNSTLDYRNLFIS